MIDLLAHGIGGIRDLPIPIRWFFYGGAIVLVVSFVALVALWRRPVLERVAAGRAAPGGLSRFLLSPVLRLFVQVIALDLLVVIFLAAVIGPKSSGANLAPYVVYVVFWIGMPIVVVLLGNVWSVLNPWRAAADLVGLVVRRERPPLEYPERLGRWPAAFLLFCFAALELAYVDPANPRTVAVAIGIYSAITWVGMYLFGRDAWLTNGEAFTVYFSFFARIAPLAAEGGRVVVRPFFAGLAQPDARRGTVPFVAVMLGSVLWDGFSRTSFWQDTYYDVQVDLLDNPTAADIVGTLMSIGGLAVAVTVVGLLFRLAALAAAWVAEHGRDDLSDDFVWSLVPIALVYVIAHYFTSLVYQGQVAIRLASDAFGKGWDLFGTIDFEPNFTLFTPNAVWYVQVASLVVGHVAGLALAHDRAVGLFRSSQAAMWSQFPMLALMVAYTVGGMWLLSQG